jgi:Ca2+-binding RTX toxin-like protein
MSSPFNGTSGADIMLGTSGDDVFLASSGDDRIWGGAGGTDRLTLTGALSDYTIRGDGSFTLTDLRDNGDGVDFVRAIDIFQFSDVSISASNLLALGQNGISGTAGNDTLLGTGRDDRIEGGAGNDALWGGSGGDDTAVFSGASSD